MKILSLYLPQFHEVPENNDWWGDGFTEWVNVKKAEPLYSGHNQPIVPLNENYYDLTDPSALVWQSQLAAQNNVDGFVFFHYWYEGKRLLEKPVELWLQTPQAELEFSLCWANHPWTRSWDGKEHEVLQPQTYGGKEDWDEHLNYLLQFFRDPRYILKDNKPQLFIYNAGAIPNVNAMIKHWELRLIEEGFAGLYLVEYISTKNPSPSCSHSQAVYEDEPLYSLRFEINALEKAKRLIVKKLGLIDYQDYDRIWSRMLRKKRRYAGREIVQGAFVAWDNSPRRGKKGPMIVRNAAPEKFYQYLKELLLNHRVDSSRDFLLINAWNEWGEGAILEPSQAEGFGYIDAVKRARNSNQPDVSLS